MILLNNKNKIKMTRVLRNLLEMDTEFQRPFAFSMVLLFIQMCWYMFSYASLFRTVIMLYLEYICFVFSDDIKGFFQKQRRSFRPQMAPQAQHNTDDDDDDGYDEENDGDEDEDEDDEDEDEDDNPKHKHNE